MLAKLRKAFYRRPAPPSAHQQILVLAKQRRAEGNIAAAICMEDNAAWPTSEWCLLPPGSCPGCQERALKEIAREALRGFPDHDRRDHGHGPAGVQG